MTVHHQKMPSTRTEEGYLAKKRPCAVTMPTTAEEAASTDHRSTSDGVRIGTMESYKILHKIGEGAFGAVSKARHLRTGEVVAIKSSLDAGDQALLLREATLLAACGGNPAVVGFREVVRGSESDDLHLVMEYVGQSLYDAIRARRRVGLPFTETETRRAMAQMLAGAGTMHANGVVHCDLKPGNVLVGKHDGQLKICDLGQAKSTAVPPLDANLEGTIGYIAPEVLLCEDCGAPVDMWSLGCIMVELVLGKSLFPEDDDLCQQLIDIIHLLGVPDDVSLMPLGIAAAAPSKLRDMVPEERLSPAGFDVLRGLLQYNPKDRLTAAAALRMPWFAAKDD
ncbi:hypothetical protein HU200_038543 [Digitaria exilis]|uniref:[RNA-polymerase]-subunit kinase n=1 Tax=Digitaria exilis TaxID=1010633 RepID=A0A835BNW4_9POAL|nr:hypothetical protein HU200_038543 [Digitaria exilis]